ncbi:YigZ family protein [Corynebacterium pseudodiphtheriticum]|uniref:YigZ family protein n=1 Tax=Corynebacterium TaxID=1716 RepID=UPI0007E981AB|nr:MULTISPECIES: YigZ family protein [Corynebacterium]MDC7109913.1 YigZ family protein [Corynebacterium pseudodiphtheriticum]MDC7111875.1 YigZ family protein [Corynebacterium pseudodiphtheriticum]MDC7114072.1 YigZ family protein [Corynebacterium pseudodiphtheriticum]MDK4236353.1 YigZ family protein [Corynebacterium pseudodiphtheriticum]MDK4241726.1 YigZ family protein [Corynebacterium pseudodiphtheriticum]
MEHCYQLPAAGESFRAEIEIKRSRFIGIIERVSDDEQARGFIDRVRAEFPDARHHCSAYVYRVDQANPVERSSDDGEPGGTAGKPILDVLNGSGMQDLACVVVRYFGGIKLGAGGLVHAYSQTAGDALAQVQRRLRCMRNLYEVSFSHAAAQKYEAELRAKNITITDTQYGADVTYTLAVDPDAVEQLESQLAALTSGTAQLVEAGTAWVEKPVD